MKLDLITEEILKLSKEGKSDGEIRESVGLLSNAEVRRIRSIALKSDSSKNDI